MALGMKNPSHWGPQEKFKEPTKKTISPTKTWEVKSGMTDRSLRFEENNEVVYTTQSHFTVKKDPYVTIHNKDDDKTAIAGTKLDSGGGDTYHIYLGDPASETGFWNQECEVKTGGNVFSMNHKFSPPGEQKDYAWRDTRQYEISIADSESSTSGRDWKFISLDEKGEEDELLAVYIHNPKASWTNKSKVFWVGKEVSKEVELWGLAAVVGLAERKRKSKDKFNFSAMVGAGAIQ